MRVATTRSGRAATTRARPPRSSTTTTSASSVSTAARDVRRARGRGRPRASAPAGTSATRRAGASDGAADQQRRAAGVLGAQVADRVDGRVDRVDRHGVGQRHRARRRSPSSYSGSTASSAATDPTSAGLAVRGEQRADAVLARAGSARGSRARDSRAARSRSAALSCSCSAREPLGRRSSASTAASCSASSPSSPSSTPATCDSSTANSRRRLLAALLGGGQRLAQPADLGLRRPRPGCGGRRPGRRAGRRPRGGRRRRAARSRPPSRRPSPRPRPPAARVDGGLERGAGQLDLGGQLGLGGAHALGLRARSSGSEPPVRSGPALPSSRTRSAASDAVPRSRSRSDDSRYQTSLRLAQRRVRPRRPRARAWPGARASRPARPRPRSRRTRSALSSAISCSSVDVSCARSSASSRARASRRSAWTTAALRATSACRPSGPSWRRISPVRSPQPREVGLHRLELAERLLLALAVLEDARGLLDEAAPLLGRRAQHRVELALADDDVHLAAEAGVRQQVLDVEQPAALPVDRVLGPAVAEQRPGDRDLGVLDRQRAVGVVDGERHLGAAQRRAARRCRRR